MMSAAVLMAWASSAPNRRLTYSLRAGRRKACRTVGVRTRGDADVEPEPRIGPGERFTHRDTVNRMLNVMYH